MRRMIVAALGARTDAEFRSIVGSLPVRMTDVPGVEGGVTGTSRSYSINGKTYATRFVPRKQDPVPHSDDQPSVLDDAAPLHGPRTDTANEIAGDASLPPECSTEFDDVWYVGACATQQEIDDAIALAVAMDAEISADWSEAQSSCLAIHGNSQCSYDQEDTFVESAILAMSGPDARDEADRRWTTALPSLDDSEVTDCESAAAPTTVLSASSGELLDTMDCVGQAIAATGAVIRWAFAHGAAHRLMMGASSSGVGAVVSGLVIGGLAAGYTVGSLLVCLA